MLAMRRHSTASPAPWPCNRASPLAVSDLTSSAVSGAALVVAALVVAALLVAGWAVAAAATVRSPKSDTESSACWATDDLTRLITDGLFDKDWFELTWPARWS